VCVSRPPSNAAMGCVTSLLGRWSPSPPPPPSPRKSRYSPKCQRRKEGGRRAPNHLLARHTHYTLDVMQRRTVVLAIAVRKRIPSAPFPQAGRPPMVLPQTSLTRPSDLPYSSLRLPLLVPQTSLRPPSRTSVPACRVVCRLWATQKKNPK
jgi:hypothetical protein